jgi:hypothetical protein
MNVERLHILIDGLLEDRLAESEQAELAARLRTSAATRRAYWELVEQDVLLQEVVRESAGRDLAQMASNEPSIDPSPGVFALARPSASGWSAGLWLAACGMLLAVGISLGGYFFWATSMPREAAPSGESIAALHSLAGDVWRLDARQQAIKAASGQQFFIGDTLHVGEMGRAEVLLTDGSRLLLGAESAFRFPAASHENERRLHLERGAVEVEAARQQPGHRMVVSTDEARLVVLGTRFRLYAGSGNSRVELEEGAIRFERQSGGESVEVVAGQYAVAQVGAEASQPLIAQPLGEDWRLRHTLLRAGRQVAFSHNGLRLATASHTHIKVWDRATGELGDTLKTSASSDSFAFALSDEAIVALSESGQALFWRIGEPTAVHTELKCEDGLLRRCAVAPGGRWLAQTTGVDAGYLPIWKVEESGAISRVCSIPMKMSSVALVESNAGPLVAASAWNGTTVKWEATTGEELARYRFQPVVTPIALSLDGRLLAGYGNADGLLLVDMETGQAKNLWPPGSVRVNWLRFSANAKSVFAAMNDGMVRAWSTADGRPRLVLSTGDERLTSLDVSADGNWLATAGDGGNVKVWQCKSE